jgi:hypothetical protein
LRGPVCAACRGSRCGGSGWGSGSSALRSGTRTKRIARTIPCCAQSGHGRPPAANAARNNGASLASAPSTTTIGPTKRSATTLRPVAISRRRDRCPHGFRRSSIQGTGRSDASRRSAKSRGATRPVSVRRVGRRRRGLRRSRTRASDGVLRHFSRLVATTRWHHRIQRWPLPLRALPPRALAPRLNLKPKKKKKNKQKIPPPPPHPPTHR